MWQKEFEKYKSDSFTVVGIAMDVEGVAPAKLYYEKYGVKFNALVDPNYATRFGYVPWTFLIDEHGVVQDAKNWKEKIKPKAELKAVTPAIRSKFMAPKKRLDAEAVAVLVKQHQKTPEKLTVASELSSRYLLLGQHESARQILAATTKHYDAKLTARKGTSSEKRELADAYLQLSRASIGERDKQVEFATLAYYLNPSVGFGKQIARIIAPEKFDRPDGRFDNDFREATLRRLRDERKKWLAP